MTESASPLGEDLVRARQEVVTAAEHGDELAFAALAQRIGSLEEAQRLVRSKAFVRMAGRGVVRKLTIREVSAERDVGDSEGPTLHGHFAVFNEWTEIDSMFEGHFLERIAPGAFRKSFEILTPKVTFQHGQDPFLGDKVLGKITRLEEDEIGADYEVGLFRGLPDLLMEGLRADEYGASFRFRVMRELFDETPDDSEHNPHGLPERTLKEAQVPEFGPVTYPAYPAATAGVRSADGEREIADAPSDDDAAVDEHPGDAQRSSENGTSSAERSENLTWPRVTDEEWDQLWIPKT
jgi:phage head maturation protease